jgi:hypothetical protein
VLEIKGTDQAATVIELKKQIDDRRAAGEKKSEDERRAAAEKKAEEQRIATEKRVEQEREKRATEDERQYNAEKTNVGGKSSSPASRPCPQRRWEQGFRTGRVCRL